MSRDRVIHNRPPQVVLFREVIPMVWTTLSIMGFFASIIILNGLSSDGTFKGDLPLACLLGMYIPAPLIINMLYHAEKPPWRASRLGWGFASLGSPLITGGFLWLNAAANARSTSDMLLICSGGIFGFFLMQLCNYLPERGRSEGAQPDSQPA